MKRITRKNSRMFSVTALLLICLMVLTGCGGTGGSAGTNDPDSVMKGAAEYLVENVEVDSADSMGGGWVPFALKMSGTDAAGDDYYAAYFDSIRAIAKSQAGVISQDHPTAHERVSINLKAIGEDPTSVEGHDLMKIVDDYKAVSEQGINAEIYALIAANYVGYTLKNEDQYLYDVLANQLPDGSFGMDQDHPDTDVTAMAVQALAHYDGNNGGTKADKRAEGAVTRALEWLSAQQKDDGSYGSAESTAQVMIALGCLGKDPEAEADFIKGENTLYDGLMVYRVDRGFCHEAGGEEDIMATEQALMGLDAMKLAKEGNRLFA